MEIIVVHDPPKERLEAKGVFGWPVWSKEPSEFPWTYEAEETCYFREGRVVVTPDGGAPVEAGPRPARPFAGDAPHPEGAPTGPRAPHPCLGRCSS